MPDHVPFPVPNLANKVKPQGTDLTPQQQELYDAVLKHFTDEAYVLPSFEGEDGKLKEEEKFWLSYECLLRYLRAVSWSNPISAIKRLENTLKWRREYGWYDKITAEHVEPEGVTGKAVIFGYDVAGRPAFYMTPSKQNTEESPRQVEFTFFIMERAIDLMGPGVETQAIMVNFADRGKNPSMTTSRAVLDILQTHYPERLGSALIINVPFVINLFFKIIMPFLDPITRAKVHFNPKPVEDGLFDKEQIVIAYGGERDFQYSHEEYWPALLKMAEENRTKWKAKWKEMGATIGLKEWEYKSGPEWQAEAEAAAAAAATGTETPTAPPATGDSTPEVEEKLQVKVEIAVESEATSEKVADVAAATEQLAQMAL